MSFSTKKYTRPYLVNAVKNVNVSNFGSFKAFANALSPRAGSKSAQVAALRKALRSSGATLKDVFNGGGSNQTNKSFLLSLLNNY